jgi:6-phosphogluconolactonase
MGLMSKQTSTRLIITAALSIGLSGCMGKGPILPPCFLCDGGVSKNFVYTANAAGSPSTVSALASDAATGALTAVAGSPYGTGSGSLAIAADPTRRFLYVANAQSSDITAFNINFTSGALSPVAGSPFRAESGMDSIAIDTSGQFLYAVSGNSENLWAYSINSSTGALTPLGAMPMAIAPSGMTSSSVVVDPSGKYLYVTSGNSFSWSIYGFGRDTTTGALTGLAGFPATLDGFANKSTFDRTGKFLLVTGTNVFGTQGGIDIFTLNSTTGALTLAGSPVQVGDGPSGIVVDATGTHVYVPNTADATISAFTLDNISGSLVAIAGSPFLSGGKGSVNGPLGIANDDSGHFIYVCNASNDVSVFSVSAVNGALTPIAGSPFHDGGNGPNAIIFVP